MEFPHSDVQTISFDSFPELEGFTEDPIAMYVGCPGKRGHLTLGFEVDKSGKSILRDLDRRAPLIVQQALYFDKELPELPCVYILSSGGPNVDGDRYSQNIWLKKDAMAYIGTGAATKLAEMKRNYSGMRQSINLEDGAYLEYRPEPIIPCRHTRYISDTSITIAPSATIFYSEIYMPGRKYYANGERFVYDLLSICAHAQRPDGKQLFREKFIIAPLVNNVRQLGIMGDFDVFANVIVLTPPEKAAAIYSHTNAAWQKEANLAYGITYLPNEAGLLFKALGMEPGPVKNLVRNFCSTVRQMVKGRPLPPEFPWR